MLLLSGHQVHSRVLLYSNTTCGYSSIAAFIYSYDISGTVYPFTDRVALKYFLLKVSSEQVK